jgi:uncharacterized protein YndB with AHSA1/START domain
MIDRTMSDMGTVISDGDTRTVRFERRLGFPPADVWAALTEPEQLGDWLATATVDLRVGGHVSFDFDGEVCHGEVLACEPPALLEYEWRFPDEHRSVVRWTLRPADDGRRTVLTLVHQLLTPDIATGYGAGWHAHLDQLAGHLAGDTPDWLERYQALRPAYDART